VVEGLIEVSSIVIFHRSIIATLRFMDFGEYLGRAQEAETLAETETYGWLFVNVVPLLYNKKKVERQLKIEEWLDLYQLTRELGIADVADLSARRSAINYVI